MFKLSHRRLPIPELNTVFWAGLATAIGAFGVTVASVFYALSPAQAALPIPNPSPTDAHNAMIAGHTTMVAAGTIGIVFDLILATGTLLLLIFRKPASLYLERAGWALMTMSTLIFVGVDALAASTLTHIATSGGITDAFMGFKLLFDLLFILGTIAFGLGTLAIFISEINSRSPVLAKPFLWFGILAAIVGFISGILYFAQVSLPQVVGGAILVGAAIFAIYGAQIARVSLKAKSNQP